MKGIHVICVVLFTTLGLSLVTFLRGVVLAFQKSSDLILGEGFLWAQADIVSRGEALFRPLGDSWYLVVPHTPLYVFLVGILSSVFGSSMLMGRLVSLVFGLGICILVFLIVRRLTSSNLVALASGLMVLSLQSFRLLGTIFRMDTMGVFLSLLGVYLVFLLESKGYKVLLAVPFLVLALLTKQLFFTAPIAVCLYLLIRDRSIWRPLLFGSSYLLLLGVSILIGNLLTSGQMWSQNFVYMTYGAYALWETFRNATTSFAFYHFPILVLALGILAYKFAKRATIGIFDVYFIVALIILLLSIGKPGASSHYGLETLVIACILVGKALEYSVEVLRGSPGLRPVLISGFIVVLVILQVVGFPLGQGYSVYSYTPTNQSSVDTVLWHIDSAEGPVYSHQPVFPLMAGADTVWDPIDSATIYLYGLQARRWDQGAFVGRFISGYYKLVILPYDISEWWAFPEGTTQYRVARQRFSPEVANAIIGNYELIDTSGTLGTAGYQYKAHIYEYVGSKALAKGEVLLRWDEDSKDVQKLVSTGGEYITRAWSNNG